MHAVADETAYFFNRKIPAVALISKGLILPAGTWLRVANAPVPRQQVELMLRKLFPEIRALMFVTLATAAEVEEFEASLIPPS
jgi:hypothetical protein